jgi:hypothetical protein
LVQGELACVQGSSFWFFELWFGGLRILLELCFVSDVFEPLPLPKGSETCLLQVILRFAFFWLSIACWSLFLFVSFPFLFLSLLLLFVGVVNALIKVEIEDHVWFEDRWKVAS